MKSASSFGLGTSLIAATVTAATVVAVAPAQAAQMGSISLDGDAVIPSDGPNPMMTTVQFEPAKLPISASGYFEDLVFPTDDPLGSPTFKELKLTQSMGNMYQTGDITSFINFGTQTIKGKTAQLTFDLFDTKVTRNWISDDFQIYVTIEGAKGQFMFDGTKMASGFFSASRSGAPDGSSYQMTLTKDVPEPLTTLGTGLALGFGGLLQRHRSGKGKNQKQA